MNIRKYIRGTCRVRCEDRDYIRLINICSHRDIFTWNCTQDKGSEFCTYLSDMDTLLSIADKCGMKLEFTEQNSLKLLLRRNRRRLSLAIGIALCVAAIYIESLYIWHIDINGCESYTEDEILDMIELEYPCYGHKKSDINTSELREMLTDSFGEICWVSCSISGTCLTVDIKESVDVFTDMSVSEPSNITASMDCTIYSIVTSAGTPVAVAGDEVKKGDILISGAVNICNDDSEVVDTRYVAASGEVYGLTRLNYSDETELSHYVKNQTSESICGADICLFGFMFSPYDKAEDDRNYDVSADESVLHIGDFYLPVSITIKRRSYYELSMETYTEAEAKNIANSHLAAYIDELQQKGVQILQKNVIIASGSECVTAEGTLSAKLPVGVPELIEPDVISGEAGDEDD